MKGRAVNPADAVWLDVVLSDVQPPSFQECALQKVVIPKGMNALFDGVTYVQVTTNITNTVLNLVTGTTAHPIAYGVDDFQITMEPMRSETSTKTGGTWDLLKRAAITFGRNQHTKTSSAPKAIGSPMPRS